MKAAFAYLNKRIAPVFDTARHFHLVEVQSGRIVSETEETMALEMQVHKTQRLAGMGIDTLICGAISRPLQAMVAACGIRVIPFVAGDLDVVVRAWLKGGLHGRAFAMPGCCGNWRGKHGGFVLQEVEKMNKKGQGGMGGGRGQGGGMGGGRGQGGGMGGGGGKGRGRMSGPLAAGAVGTCVCPKCGERLAHERGVPCVQRQCPKCGTALIRE